MGYLEDTGLNITAPFNLDSAILKEGINVWKNKIEPNKKEGDFLLIICTIPQQNSEWRAIDFVNKKLLSKTVKNNLPLYQVFQGPLLTEEKFMSEFIDKEMSFFNGQSGRNNILTGITLGYGAENALCVSRFEEIEESVYSDETPPFKNAREFLNFSYLDVLDCIASENNAKKSNPLQPSPGYITIKEEYQELAKQISLSPEPLRSENPRFIFGYLKDHPASLAFIERLLVSQKKIQKRLQKDSFLADCVMAFSGVRIIIDQDDSLTNALTIISKKQWNELVSKRFLHTLMEEGYSSDDQLAFLEGFKSTSFPSDTLDFYGVDPNFLKNLRSAQDNLKTSHLLFSKLGDRAQMKELIPQYLYMESLKNGTKQEANQASKVLLDYVIYNPKGEILKSAKGESVALAETISGFAQGVKQMKVGETVRLYIHPSLAYGLETFSEKGIYLVAEITLRKIEQFSREPLSPLVPENLSYILDPNWLSKVLEKRKLAMKNCGWKAGCFFKKSPLLNTEEIASQIHRHLSSSSEKVDISEVEKNLLNRLYWSI
jgi:FKBP-type peptidyl-prolyl cis-trans isomerase FklB